jgi:hypothetical protein
MECHQTADGKIAQQVGIDSPLFYGRGGIWVSFHSVTDCGPNNNTETTADLRI